jgi:hypothetical protein
LEIELETVNDHDELAELIDLPKKKKNFRSDLVQIDEKKLQHVKDKLTQLLKSIREIDCQESIEGKANSSLLFRLEPRFTNLI